ncbi:aldo/keto reductase [Paenibacillus solisilvae]|uniref:Aldo/keto reductase n=1 Tax=Paenibacillus solisilvae TaxID=2486751 RepID=A0ABW0W4Z2_9BACL
MQYNNLSKTSLKVSILSLGTMMFGGQTSEADSLKIMDYAFEHGINFFDTANSYNQGESEKIVGKGLKGRRDEIILATKVRGNMGENPNNAGLSRRNILSAVDASLKRLDTDYIDIYYMHAPDYETSIEESIETMSSLVKSGKIRYIGVSNYAAWQIADMLSICDKRNYIAPIITQNVYNPITRGIETELVPFLKAHDMGMAIYNPIAGGLLAGKHKPGQPAENTRFANNGAYFDRYWSDENFAAADKLTQIAGKCGLSILQLAMKWCAAQESVTSIISGVSRLAQIEQNIASIEGEPLDVETLLKCDDVWRSLAGTRFGYNR